MCCLCPHTLLGGGIPIQHWAMALLLCGSSGRQCQLGFVAVPSKDEHPNPTDLNLNPFVNTEHPFPALCSQSPWQNLLHEVVVDKLSSTSLRGSWGQKWVGQKFPARVKPSHLPCSVRTDPCCVWFGRRTLWGLGHHPAHRPAEMWNICLGFPSPGLRHSKDQICTGHWQHQISSCSWASKDKCVWWSWNEWNYSWDLHLQSPTAAHSAE